MKKMTGLSSAPAEVLHQICVLLSIQDVANLRLTNKILADIGAHYLVRQVKFHTSEESLDRLKALAHHKIFSQHVRTLCFEANLLANICCQSHWAEQFKGNGHGRHGLDMPTAPVASSSIREKRLYARNMAKWEEEVGKRYQQFRALYNIQQETHRRTPAILDEAIPNFSKLTHIRLTIGRCQHVLSKRFLDEFETKAGFCCPLSFDTGPTPQQLTPLLAPSGKAVEGLQSILAADINPSFFTVPSNHRMIQAVFATMKKIDLSFRLASRDENTEEPGLYEAFKNGCLRDALSCATGLQELRVSFNDYDYDGPCIAINDILGDHSFAELKKLSLGYVESSEKTFVDFLKRQPCLESLSIFCVYVDGSWVNVLNKMQQQLELKSTVFDGFLQDDDRMYDMEYAEVDYYMDCGDTFTVAMAIDCFLCYNKPLEETNPLSRYDDEFGSEESLHELYHDMLAEMGEDCESCAENEDDLSDEKDSLTPLV